MHALMVVGQMSRLTQPMVAELKRLAGTKPGLSAMEVGVGVSTLGARVNRIVEVIAALVNPKSVKDRPLFEVRSSST